MSHKTHRKLPRRLALLVLAGAIAVFGALPAAPAAAAPAPWWQIVTGSRPSTLAPGGEGRLTLSIINIGDAPVNATSQPLVIEDELPVGVSATEVFAFAGTKDNFGPLECALDTAIHLSCEFKGTLPSYEAFEIEVFVDVAAEPPVGGEAGEVTVAGANAPADHADQPLLTGPDPTPFGIERFSAKVEEEGGGDATRAGSHPFQLTSAVQFNSGPATGVAVELRADQPAQPRNLRASLPVGMVGNAAAAPRCELNDFYERKAQIANNCPDASALGVINLAFHDADTLGYVRAAIPVFNLTPGYGEPARFGFTVVGNPILLDFSVDPDNEYRLLATFHNTTQVVQLLSGTLVVWGSPGDPRHDSSRGWGCAYNVSKIESCQRPPSLSEDAFLRMPVSCSGPLPFSVEAEPWNVPVGSSFATASLQVPGMNGCNQVPFDPKVNAAPSTKLAANPSGLDYNLTMPNAGLLKPEAIAEGQAKKVEVTLPAGMTLNPSQAEGLTTCSEAQYAAERYNSQPGAGCPDASKIGEVKVQTPLLTEEARGSVYVATPYDNPFSSLIALYIVARIPERGILIKQAGIVTPDPVTGQITTTFDELPQLPFSSFQFRFRPGARAPLATPPACGGYDITTRFVPWSAADPNNPTPAEVVTRTSSFEVERGADGDACPGGGLPPFHPQLTAGTENNAAGSFSPFNVKLTRTDAEQEFTNFSIKLPPGIAGKLAGIPFCSDAQIAAAAARTGPHGGAEELAAPSCPAASQVGRTLAGAGVGGSLAYAPGKIYLAGPYHGAPLSMVSITSGVVGPFDIGTVVVRLAVKVNPETAEVFLDSTGSDPIPHIIKGIVLHLRDIRAYADRPEFTYNPTSCKRTSTAATVLGSGLDFVSPADDNPFVSVSPFQAADCASLGFEPRLAIKLSGGTKRNANPALTAVLKARPGDANVGAAKVTLPHSAFLDQSHIKTVCTRVQFNAGAGNGAGCPAGSIYGSAEASTPLLDEALKGPVYLRSSSHPLPDLVVALHSGKIDVNLVGRIDTGKGGGIRTSFESVPDAPVNTFTLHMLGGKKGLIVNSTNLCASANKAVAEFTGQNAKKHDFRPVVKPTACKGAKSKSKRTR